MHLPVGRYRLPLGKLTYPSESAGIKLVHGGGGGVVVVVVVGGGGGGWGGVGVVVGGGGGGGGVVVGRINPAKVLHTMEDVETTYLVKSTSHPSKLRFGPRKCASAGQLRLTSDELRQMTLLGIAEGVPSMGMRFRRTAAADQ